MASDKMEKPKRMVTLDVRIPYDTDGNLGRAYNAAMAQTSADVVVFFDHDLFLCNPHWHPIITKIMTDNPTIGMLTCRTNNIFNRSQKDTAAPIGHDLAEHRAYARKVWDRYQYAVTDIPSCSGMMMAVRVDCWYDVGDFIDGFFNVDTDFSKRVAASRWRLARADGLYVYHLRDRTEGPWIEGEKTSMSYL